MMMSSSYRKNHALFRRLFLYSEILTVGSFHLKKYKLVPCIYSHLTLTSSKAAHRWESAGHQRSKSNWNKNLAVARKACQRSKHLRLIFIHRFQIYLEIMLLWKENLFIQVGKTCAPGYTVSSSWLSDQPGKQMEKNQSGHRCTV